MTRFVSISLVGNPNLENPNDERRKKIIELCRKVAEFDPEFILKVSQCAFLISRKIIT